MYGDQKTIRHNLRMFLLDGITFNPSLVLLSGSAVVPYFLDQLGASTFQIAFSTSMIMICVLLTQPFFGIIASRSITMNKTFSKIALIQRLFFLLFIFLIPVFAENNSILIYAFLVSWCIFHLFIGSYAVFYTPMVIRLLPPDKRGGTRGLGLAIGSFIGVGISALIPTILERIIFPYNYMTIFAAGIFFLLINAGVFYCMRQSEDMEPNEPMKVMQYLKNMPSIIKENSAFRAVLLTCIFIGIANSVLPFYTLFGIREFSLTDTDIATFAGLAILTSAIANIVFGFLVDRFGSRNITAVLAAIIICTGALVLFADSLNKLLVVWTLANLSNSGSIIALSILLGEVAPPTKLPLYVGVQTTISTALAAVIILGLAPVLENLGFTPFFITVLMCGTISLAVNLFVLKKRMLKINTDNAESENLK